MEYYYTEAHNIFLNENTLVLKGFEYKHLIKVLRKSIGDFVIVTDGKRNIYECSIVNIKKDIVLCNISNTKYNLFEPDLNVRLFVSPLRNSDRFEFLIEKCVELGVYSIHPVISKFTIQKNVFSELKLARLRKITISAMGQSQRCYLPEINNAIDFNELLSITKGLDNKIVYYEFAEHKEKSDFNTFKTNDLCVYIGPEGGFDKCEIDLLCNNNWQVRSLGNRKLRSETAAIISVFENINKYK